MIIRDEDFIFESNRRNNLGGQQVSMTDTSIKVTHIPTDISAIVNSERSQLKNRQLAKSMIIHGLLESGWKIKETENE